MYYLSSTRGFIANKVSTKTTHHPNAFVTVRRNSTIYISWEYNDTEVDLDLSSDNRWETWNTNVFLPGFLVPCWDSLILKYADLLRWKVQSAPDTDVFNLSPLSLKGKSSKIIPEKNKKELPSQLSWGKKQFFSVSHDHGGFHKVQNAGCRMQTPTKGCTLLLFGLHYDFPLWDVHKALAKQHPYRWAL